MAVTTVYEILLLFWADVTGHVLSRFTPNEQKQLPQLLDAAAEAVEKILLNGATEAMNSFNNYSLVDKL